jgi:hypothetical protein
MQVNILVPIAESHNQTVLFFFTFHTLHCQNPLAPTCHVEAAHSTVDAIAM